MLDLSEEPLEENIEISKKYLERMSKMGMTLEIELGITGGEEDGVDNSGVDSSQTLYSARRSLLCIRRVEQDFAKFYHSRIISEMCMVFTNQEM